MKLRQIITICLLSIAWVCVLSWSGFASETLIPDDWQRHEHFGFSVSVPADFEVIDRLRDEISYGSMDDEANTAFGVRFSNDPADVFLQQVDIVSQEPVQLSDGSSASRIEMAVDESNFSAVGIGLVLQPEEPGQPGGSLLVTMVNMEWTDEKRAKAEKILGSIEYLAAEPELESALEGLLSYALPSGWRVQFSLREHLDLIRGAMEGPVLTVGTGQVGRDMAGLTNRVIQRSALLSGDFTESEGEILGQRARIFEGDSDWVSGWYSRVYVLELCAPGNAPIVFHAAMRSEEQEDYIDDMLASMRLNLPEGMAPCPEAMGPGSSWSRDGRLAIGGIEGMEGRATMREVSFRPSDEDHNYPDMRLSVEYPLGFNNNFQVGNRHGHGFAEPPLVAETEVAGHGALAFTGRGEASERRWDFHVYLLQTCLPDDVPVIVQRRRDMEDPLAGDLPDPMLESLFIDLPPDAAPCKPALIDDALERVEATRPSPASDKAAAEDPVHEEEDYMAMLRDMERQGKLTVRALGAFGLLPDDFMQTAVSLRTQGKDLLAADRETLQDWLKQADQGQMNLGPDERAMLEDLIFILMLEDNGTSSMNESLNQKSGKKSLAKHSRTVPIAPSW